MRISTQYYMKNKQELLKAMRWSEDTLVRYIKQDYKVGAQCVYAKTLSQSMRKGRSVADSKLVDYWDAVWYFSRELHAVLPECTDSSAVITRLDLTSFNTLEKDLTIDTVVHGREVCIHLAHRAIPIRGNDWSVRVVDSTLHKLVFHFKASENVREVYVTECESDKSGVCLACKRLACYNTLPYTRSLFKDDSCICGRWDDPVLYLTVIATVVKAYALREKCTRSSDTVLSVSRSLMVATPDVGEETVRPIPLHNFIKEYNSAVRGSYKGGTHKSPVCHQRSAFYRRCKHGDYILKDGDFIQVAKGAGNFCRVRSTIVNAHKNETLADMI